MLRVGVLLSKNGSEEPVDPFVACHAGEDSSSSSLYSAGRNCYLQFVV